MTDAPVQVHDKCKQVIVFHNHLVHFFHKLKETFPDLKRQISNAVKKYKSMTRSEYLKLLHAELKPHIERISEYDEGIFSDDYIVGPLNLILEIDFKQLWAIIDGEDFLPDESDDNPVDGEKFRRDAKQHIFNSVQAIYICSEIALSQIGDFDKALHQQTDFLMNMIGNLNIDETLKDKIDKLVQAEKDAAGGGFGGLESLEKLGELFGEDNFIYQLAKDVAEEVNIGSDCDSPVDALKALFADGGKKLQELIISVGNKLEEKVQSGEISQEQLMADAEKMRERIQSTVGNIPGLSDIMNQTDITQKIREKYDLLNDEEKQRFKGIIPILDKSVLKWKPHEKKKIDAFMKYSFSKTPDNE